MQRQTEFTLGDEQTEELQPALPSVPGRKEECGLSRELERSQSGPFGALHHLGELHS